MNRKLFTILTALLWGMLPLTALCYWQVWDRLPARMATHFGANGQPNDLPAGEQAEARVISGVTTTS